MSPRFRLVAFDIDGTIADPETGVIPPQVRAAIAHLADLGIPVVLTTGRAWVATQEAIVQLGRGVAESPDIAAIEEQADPGDTDFFTVREDAEPFWYVCSNGAVVMSYPPLHVIRFDTFDPAPYIPRLASIPGVLLAAEDFGVGYRVTQPFDIGVFQGTQTVVSLDDLAATPVVKIVANLKDGSLDFHHAVDSLDLSPLAVFPSPGDWYDVCAEGTSKARGLKTVTDRLGIDREEVLAFGDGDNDIEILRWAGRGVAIGDASDVVKQAADAVAPRFHEGGVLPELARWFGDLPDVTSTRKAA